MSERDVQIQGRVLDDILDERRRQDRKWGVQNHSPAVWMLILAEEVGEAAIEVLPACYDDKGAKLRMRVLEIALAGEKCRVDLETCGCPTLATWAREMTDREAAAYREEMVQVATVAVAAIECLDRAAAGGTR